MDLQRWVGRKVTIGTTDGHYVSGRVVAIEGPEIVVAVGESTVRLRSADVDRVQPAPPEQVEFVK